MYSAVLMMALTTGVDTPDIGRRGGGCGGGCYGGCYGGGGGGGRRGRRGGGGGCCGCYGGGYGGCYGGGYAYGGCWGGGMGGCYSGGMGMGGGCYGGGMPMQMGPGGTTGTPEQLKKTPTEKGKSTQAEPASATIVVNLPADAKLLIDNQPTTSVGDSRVFVSPALKPGREYHYTLKAEVVRDGKPATVEQVITVRAGEITPASLTLPAVGVAQR